VRVSRPRFQSSLSNCATSPETALVAYRSGEKNILTIFPMVIVGFLLLLIIGGYGVWRLCIRAPGPAFGWSSVWRVALLIGAVRIAALWIGLAGLQRSNWLQVLGQFLFVLAWPELYFVRAVRAEPIRWALSGSLILAATSLVWAVALLWVVRRLAGKASV
jgi:hypothetical protein